MSVFSRVGVEMRNAFNDAYGSIVYGDDVGKSAKLVFIARPRISSSGARLQTSFDLGMSFTEVNRRAYVRNIHPSSDAFKAGVQAQDCVQFALALGDRLAFLREDEKKAKSYALECEKKGMRTSYEQLNTLIRAGNISEHLDELDATIGQEEYYTQSSFENDASEESQPRSPSASELLRNGVVAAFGGCIGQSNNFIQDDVTLNHSTTTGASVSEMYPCPIVLVVRRTRQRQSHELAPSYGIPSYGLGVECNRAASLIWSLSPTRRVAMKSNGQEESIFNGTNWLLPSESKYPISTTKINDIRTRIVDESTEAESNKRKNSDDIDAKTILEMIQIAVGLAFLHTSKAVLGMSLNGGIGIIISRLPDGTWSTPSAIGMTGSGLGLHFGVEAVDYMFILQTKESMEYFRHGRQFTIGEKLGGTPVTGIDRETYITVSIGSPIIEKQSPNVDTDFFHIVAHTKSRGLCSQVSLEGNEIYTRNDINSKSYNLNTSEKVTARDILDGKISRPIEAEEMYGSLHCFEHYHELTGLSRPPKILRDNCNFDWVFDRCCFQRTKGSIECKETSFSFISRLSKEDQTECSIFEDKFKKLMYGGLYVQQLIPNTRDSGDTIHRDRRTLWLMHSPQGSLRLGYLSKINNEQLQSSPLKSTDQDNENSISNAIDEINTLPIEMSDNNSVALTEVICLRQQPNIPLRLSPSDGTEHLRLISIIDTYGRSLLFLADNVRESEIIFCGIKLLLERETACLGIRGGQPISQLENISRSTASRDIFSKNSTSTSTDGTENDNLVSFDDEICNEGRCAQESIPDGKRCWSKVPTRSYLRYQANKFNRDKKNSSKHKNKEVSFSPEISLNVQGNPSKTIPLYTHGQLIKHDVALNFELPLPFLDCRALLLDASSPVMCLWESKLLDTQALKTSWQFSSDSKRKIKQNYDESKPIVNRCMIGAYRTVKFGQVQKSNTIELTETQIVDTDDENKVCLCIKENLPRRGLFVKMKISIYGISSQLCEAFVVGEITVSGKDMLNQLDIDKTLPLVIEEINRRYGIKDTGLLGCFLSTIKAQNFKQKEKCSQITQKSHEDRLQQKTVRGYKISQSESPKNNTRSPGSEINASSSSKSVQNSNSKKSPKNNHSYLSLSSPKNRKSPNKIPISQELFSSTLDLDDEELPQKNSFQEVNDEEKPRHSVPNRPGTPALDAHGVSANPKYKEDTRKKYTTSTFTGIPPSTEGNGSIHNDNLAPIVTISVKPLPKIRLDLMPSPREEDEDTSSVDMSSPKTHRHHHHTKSKSHRSKGNRSSRHKHRKEL